MQGKRPWDKCSALGERDQTPHPKDEEIQRLKHELADVQNFMESIIQSIGSGIILTQMDDTITYINRAGEKILGYVKHELVGKTFRHLRFEGEAEHRSFPPRPSR